MTCHEVLVGRWQNRAESVPRSRRHAVRGPALRHGCLADAKGDAAFFPDCLVSSLVACTLHCCTVVDLTACTVFEGRDGLLSKRTRKGIYPLLDSKCFQWTRQNLLGLSYPLHNHTPRWLNRCAIPFSLSGLVRYSQTKAFDKQSRKEECLIMN